MNKNTAIGSMVTIFGFSASVNSYQNLSIYMLLRIFKVSNLWLELSTFQNMGFVSILESCTDIKQKTMILITILLSFFHFSSKINLVDKYLTS